MKLYLLEIIIPVTSLAFLLALFGELDCFSFLIRSGRYLFLRSHLMTSIKSKAIGQYILLIYDGCLIIRLGRSKKLKAR